ncbi:MAG: hypothetical protein JO112_22600 [Planctomycetes bacterium]|nr:hypothetical protein [Planctomycetota bacterium]
MARRVLNRRELRKTADQAEQQAQEKKRAADPGSPKKAAKEKAPPKAKKTRKKKEPPRMCARWGVFDAAMRQVAIFDYNQRAAADQKVADLAAKKNAIFFLQIVKEPMPEPPPVEEVQA